MSHSWNAAENINFTVFSVVFVLDELNECGKLCLQQHYKLDCMEDIMFEAVYYVVAGIDGDYANLRRMDTEEEDLKLVARALLPEEIMEGTKLKYELMQYEIIE